MRLTWSKLAALVIGLSVASVLAWAARPLWKSDECEVDPQWLAKISRIESARAEAMKHRERILADLEEEQEEWEGSYSWSNGFEHRVLDLSESAFFYEYSHCTGTGELAYGQVTGAEGARISLRPVFRQVMDEPQWREGRSRFLFETELYSIHWDGARYLAPASLMAEFCRLTKATSWDSMRYADYPRKTDSGEERDWFNDLPSGLPEVPAEFQGLLPHR